MADGTKDEDDEGQVEEELDPEEGLSLDGCPSCRNPFDRLEEKEDQYFRAGRGSPSQGFSRRRGKQTASGLQRSIICREGRQDRSLQALE